MKTALLIIDAQYDFCDPKGTLFVPGAPEDVERIAKLIAFHGDRLDSIFVTLDTHQVIDIAHPLFWEDPNGNTVAPFTLISTKSVEEGRWIPRYDKEYVLHYLKQLENEGLFQHFIWPEHCLIGSDGAALDKKIMDAVLAWSHRAQKGYRAVVKGTNPLTEHFGIFKAQVTLKNAPETSLDQSFLEELNTYDRILVVGEARSHCVATSIQQIIQFAPELISKVVVLTDCMSDVPNWGHLADPIFENAREKGMIFTTSQQVFKI